MHVIVNDYVDEYGNYFAVIVDQYFYEPNKPVDYETYTLFVDYSGKVKHFEKSENYNFNYFFNQCIRNCSFKSSNGTIYMVGGLIPKEVLNTKGYQYGYSVIASEIKPVLKKKVNLRKVKVF